MKRHNVLGMAVGCYLAAFKRDERGPTLLGLHHENDVKLRAAEVLGVAPESVKNWMQEFIPYWAKSKRREVFPVWIPSDLIGRPREEGKTRESRDRMFADFELKPEAELIEMCKAILDMSADPSFDRAYFDDLAQPYLDKSERQAVFSASEVAELAAANNLPKVAKKPDGNPRPEKRRAGVAGFVFARDLEVVSWALKRSNGFCELCANLGPFLTKEGGRFLEVHHVTPLFQGGPDTVDNVAAVCPNCHRACHLAPNRDQLADQLKSRLAG
jgi:5-methylcytosine-specific restriction endonuclease McrA